MKVDNFDSLVPAVKVAGLFVLIIATTCLVVDAAALLNTGVRLSLMSDAMLRAWAASCGAAALAFAAGLGAKFDWLVWRSQLTISITAAFDALCTAASAAALILLAIHLGETTETATETTTVVFIWNEPSAEAYRDDTVFACLAVFHGACLILLAFSAVSLCVMRTWSYVALRRSAADEAARGPQRPSHEDIERAKRKAELAKKAVAKREKSLLLAAPVADMEQTQETSSSSSSTRTTQNTDAAAVHRRTRASSATATEAATSVLDVEPTERGAGAHGRSVTQEDTHGSDEPAGKRQSKERPQQHQQQPVKPAAAVAAAAGARPSRVEPSWETHTATSGGGDRPMDETDPHSTQPDAEAPADDSEQRSDEPLPPPMHLIDYYQHE